MNENKDNLNYSEALESTEEWRELTELQRKIILAHVENPSLNKVEIAKKVNCKPQNVWSLFHSKYFDRINKELAKIEKRELLQLALKSLKECLTSETQLVKLNAAVKVLSDAEVLKLSEPESKEPEKITVVWGEENAIKDKLHPSPEAVLSSPVLSKI